MKRRCPHPLSAILAQVTGPPHSQGRWPMTSCFPLALGSQILEGWKPAWLLQEERAIPKSVLWWPLISLSSLGDLSLTPSGGSLHSLGGPTASPDPAAIPVAPSSIPAHDTFVWELGFLFKIYTLTIHMKSCFPLWPLLLLVATDSFCLPKQHKIINYKNHFFNEQIIPFEEKS